MIPNKAPITGGARYLFIYPISEAYVGSHLPFFGSTEKTGGAMAPPAPPVEQAGAGPMSLGLVFLLSI